MKFASLALLVYERPEFLGRCLKSLTETDPGFPFELLVHDDGSKDPRVQAILDRYLKEKKISYLIVNNGQNRGIGQAAQACLRLASGDYLFKVDTDLEFKPSWLAEAVKILNHEPVGCVSLFDYRHYDPDDSRFNILKSTDDYLEVDDFVSSIYGFRREIWEFYGKNLGTDGWHQYIQSHGYELAISKTDFVHNFGFGLNSSSFVIQKEDGQLGTQSFSEEPLIFCR